MISSLIRASCSFNYVQIPRSFPSHGARRAWAGELLASLSLLRALHPLKDLTREQSLACVFSLGSSLELQAGVMELVGEMDYLKRLPPGDAQHQDYTVSLINYLERQRKLRIDIVSSVDCGKWSKPRLNPSLPSYAQPLVPAKGRGGDMGGRGATRGGRGERVGAQGAPNDPRAVGKAKPPKKCGFSCGQSHCTWDCPKTLEVRLKKIPIPPSVCKKCCSSVEPGVPHKPECHIYQWNKKTEKPSALTAFVLPTRATPVMLSCAQAVGRIPSCPCRCQ